MFGFMEKAVGMLVHLAFLYSERMPITLTTQPASIGTALIVLRRAPKAELHKKRHFVSDLLALTGGKLLRMAKWEKQVDAFTQKHNEGRSWNRDNISLVARRPRLMLSHLWNCKRNGTKPPKRFEVFFFL